MKISRTGIENFIRCKRCFWLDAVKKIKAPFGPPFTLNLAVDHLLKNEFDHYRDLQTVPPILQTENLNLIPFQHSSLNEWRENFIGVRTHHQATGLDIAGAVDDIWVDANKVVYVVDYKATSKEGDVSIETGWGISYKRQVEIYQWLLRQNGLAVSNTAYFVYTNAIKDECHFNNTLNFSTKIIPYVGTDNWIEPALLEINELVKSQAPPAAAIDCKQCDYLDKALNLFPAIFPTF
jgi:hypothetical protein